MKKIIPVLSLLLFQGSVVFSQSWIINTVVGGGVSTADGVPATAEALGSAGGVYLDAVGNIYLIDGRIRKVDHSSGLIYTVAGNGINGFSGDGGPATAAELNYPNSIAVDVLGDIYIADYNNKRIREVNTSGIISTIAGNGVSGFSGDGGPAIAAELDAPYGVGVDNNFNVYIPDYANDVVRKVTSGIITTYAGIPKVSGYYGDGGPATAAEFTLPVFVACDNMNNIYVTDNGRIRKITNSSGIISTVAGSGSTSYSGDGGPATSAGTDPYGIAVDNLGNIYITDYWYSRIREVTISTGIINTIAGNGVAAFYGDGGPSTAAELNTPYAVAVDGNYNVYIADLHNLRIREATDITTGISQPSNIPQLSIYPNPAQNVIYVQVQGGVKAELVEVYNITGQKMPINERLKTNNSTIEISTSALSNGVYFLKVQMQNGSTTVKKVEIIK